MDCVAPPRAGEGRGDPSVTSRCGSLRPSIYADVRYIDDVIAIEGTGTETSWQNGTPESNCLAVSKPHCALSNQHARARGR